MAQRLVSDAAFVSRVLSEAEVCHLALMDDEFPYVVPLSFVYMGGRVYFHSSLEGHKIDLLRRRPKVGLLAYVVDRKVSSDRACGFGVRYRSVQATGLAREVTDGGLKARALNALATKEAAGEPIEPVSDHEARGVAVVEIEILQAMGKQNV